ncbi:MAG TPA: hypothetical protein VGC88_01360, partial [Terriglobales bacterium]
MRITFQRKALALAGLLLATIAPAWGQVAGNNPAFDITGFIQSATLNPVGLPGRVCTSQILCGGTMTVNGITIVVPDNVIVQMPANTISYGEVFLETPTINGVNYGVSDGKGASPAGTLQTGMAMNDSPKLPGTYEVHVQGNIVVTGGTSQYIAGLLFFSQQSLNSSQGFITGFEYDSAGNSTGALFVNSAPNGTGSSTRLVINDPPISGLTNPLFPGL